MAVPTDALREIRCTDDDVVLRSVRRALRLGRVRWPPGLEYRPRPWIDGLRIRAIPFVHLDHVAEIHALDGVRFHSIPIVSHRLTPPGSAVPSFSAIPPRANRDTETQTH